jgi:ParB/RepB/Spo0J family partition protein
MFKEPTATATNTAAGSNTATNAASHSAAGDYAHNRIGHVAQSHCKEQLQSIAVSLIDTAPQMRTEFGDMQDFTNRIGAEGLQQPITVTLTEAGRYLLVTGERRLRAVKALQWVTVPAFVHEALSRESFLTMQWSENESRQNLTACERTHAIIKVIDELGADKARAALGNRSKAWIAKYAASHYFPDQTRCLLEAGMCGEIDTLTTLAKMERTIDEHIAAGAPHDDYTFNSFKGAFSLAMKGELSTATARDEAVRLANQLKWAIQSKQTQLANEVREQETAAQREQQKAQRLIDEKQAKTDPSIAAKLAKEKEARKQQRADNAEKNREAQYRYRLSQAGQGGHQSMTAARKLIEEAGERETEQRILFMLYQCVRNSIGPVLATLDAKQRKSFLRGIEAELSKQPAAKPGTESSPSGASGGTGARQFATSTTTTPPRGWVLP